MEIVDKTEVIADKRDYVEQSESVDIEQKDNTCIENTQVKSYGAVASIISALVLLMVVGGCVAIIMLASGWQSEYNMPIFYIGDVGVMVFVVVSLVLLAVGFWFAYKQGISKKIYILYSLNIVFEILALLFLMIIKSNILALISAILLMYFAFVLYNELKKINKRALYLSLPYCVWCVYAVVCCYAIVMMN